MSRAKCRDEDYIDFLIATPRAASCCEAARSDPDRPDPAAHDAYTRLLHRPEPDPGTLWAEVGPLLRKDDGVLILDDSTLDKCYAREIKPVHRHWSGKHRKVVRGINLISLVWSDGDRCMPVDYRLYDAPDDGLTKNDRFAAMIAGGGGPRLPRAVLFDSWYASLANLEQVRGLGWTFLTQLKSNRRVAPDRGGYRPVSQLTIGDGGIVVHMEGFGPLRVFKAVSRDGDVECWAINDLAMDELGRQELAERCWAAEEYHRALKQCCNVERCRARSARAQRNHVGMPIRAFVKWTPMSRPLGLDFKLTVPEFGAGVSSAEAAE